MTDTLVATPDPRPEPRCTCRFTIAHTRRDHQWVFRRDRDCPVHGGDEFPHGSNN